MLLNNLRAGLSGAAMISSFFLLSACGGQTNSSPPVVNSPAPDPQPAPGPTPVPDPLPAPAPTPVPDPQPAPQDSITLASTATPFPSQDGVTHWPDGSGTGSPIDGINCYTTSGNHIHALVAIYRDGIRLALPALIGLKGCTYETHTHDRSGVVHIELNDARTITVGQFFAVWGQPVSNNSVAGLLGPVRAYVIENDIITRFNGNPADIRFTAHKEIILVTGDTTPIVFPRPIWGGA